MDPRNPDVLVAGSFYGTVYRTTNGARSWSPISPQLPQVPTGLAIAPSASNVIWYGTAQGKISMTVNGGATWNDVTPPGASGLAEIRGFAIDPANPSHVFAALSETFFNIFGSSQGGVIETSNAGQTWTDVSGPLSAVPVNALALDDSGNLFAGTNDGVFERTVGVWSRAGVGLPFVKVTQLQVAPDGSFLAAATYGRGMWKLAAPPIAPGPPRSVVALAGEGSATVYWTPPATSGGVPILNYMVTASPGGTTATTGGDVRSVVMNSLADGTAYSFTVTATNVVGPGPPSAASNAVTPGRGQYQSLAPARILDTRNGLGAPKAAVGSGGKLDVQITGQGGVPSSGVAAVVLNVTVTDTTAGSYLTVWPAGVPQPVASNLNWTAGKTVPNLVEVAVGTDGKVSIFNAAGSTNVIFDVAGYVATPAPSPGPNGLYTPVVPKRVLDTRDGIGGVPIGPVGEGGIVTVHVNGQAGVPTSGVAAVVLNVTVTGATAPSYLTVWPAGVAQPVASNLNYVVGQTVPNRVIVQMGINGTPGWVSFYNAAGSTHVIADVGGWFSDGTDAGASGSRFVGVTPARIVDTRNGTGGFTSALDQGQTIAVTAAGVGGVPAMNATVAPTAVVLNVTATNTTAASYLTVWPDAASQPNASDLNWVPGLTVPNLVVVKVGPTGKIDLYNPAGSTDVIIDVVGWYG